MLSVPGLEHFTFVSESLQPVTMVAWWTENALQV